jgi:hypothetical protein
MGSRATHTQQADLPIHRFGFRESDGATRPPDRDGLPTARTSDCQFCSVASQKSARCT